MNIKLTLFYRLQKRKLGDISLKLFYGYQRFLVGEQWGVVGRWGAECVTFPLYQGGAGVDVEMGTHSEMSLHLYL